MTTHQSLTPSQHARSTDETLRRGFKTFNPFMVLMWRLGLGAWVNAWPSVGGRIMVLTHTGRKTGLKRRTPVNYAEVDGDIYCVAGYGPRSDWYRNLVADPRVEVWLPGEWWEGLAEGVTQPEARLPLVRQVLIASGFAAHLAGIRPKEISDEALSRATADYCLVRIRRAAPRTGREGPGDLAWVWPLATMLLLPLVLRQRRGRSCCRE
ncbi:MAG: nitroreductase family deazaflavin-dependent oxidoreductase [Anaerolineales bacterium]|nr:nitroreductase family deazaflavin-dependent oxidoreductase [Anaerolineales bacterium]